MVWSSQAGLPDGIIVDGSIPDGNLTGWSDARSIALQPNPGTIQDVNVTLELTGGYNGDLYCYLSHDGAIAVLLNRVGVTATDPFGSSGSGMAVRFDDSAPSGDVHTQQLSNPQNIGSGGFYASVNGTALPPWRYYSFQPPQNLDSVAPDGRNVDPLTVTDQAPRTALLSSFNGLDPNGSWTLFVADLSNGGQSTVAGWSLELTVGSGVPDQTRTLTLLAAACAILVWLRHRELTRGRRKAELSATWRHPTSGQ
jgi:subtilisin-like proprotein convertase family protein